MYFILGLPRSRTTWLSAFLSNDTTICYHEKSLEFPSLEKLREFVVMENCGFSDTALLVHWEWLRDNLPEAKLVVIDRLYSSSMDSLASIGIVGGSKLMLSVKNEIERIKKDDIYPVIDFKNLSSIETVNWLCTYLELPFNEKKFIEFSEMMIQPKKDLLLDRINRNIHNFKSLYGDWL